MAKIKQSVPGQANNQLDTLLTAGPTRPSQQLLLFNEQQFSEKCIKLNEITDAVFL